MTSISSTLAILAAGEDPVRALELYSRLTEDPLGNGSQWLPDIVGPHVVLAEVRPHDLLKRICAVLVPGT